MSKTPRSRKGTLALVRQIFRRPYLAVATILVNLIAALLGLLPAWFVAQWIDTLADTQPDPGLALAALAAFCVQALATAGAANLASVLGEATLRDLRVDALTWTLGRGLEAVTAASLGDVVARNSRDMETLTRTLRFAVPAMISSGLMLIAGVAAICLLDWRAALFTLVVLILSLLLAGRFSSRLSSAFRASAQAGSSLTDVQVDTHLASTTIRSLGWEQPRRRTLATERDRWLSAESQALRVRAVFLPALDGTMAVLLAGALIISAALYIQGAVGVAAATAIVLYAQQVNGPFQTLMYWLSDLLLGVVAFGRVLELKEPAPDTQAPPMISAESVVLEDVALRYAASGRAVLRDVNLRIPAGARVVIVGPSGSGKSTLAFLLAGLLSPTSGTVSRPGHAAYLPPVPHLFADSVRANLRLGAPESPSLDSTKVLQELGGSHLIETEAGAIRNLAAVDVVRVGSARMITSEAPLLVFDEFGEDLDGDQEAAISRALDLLVGATTQIKIAHRLSTVSAAELVVYVEDGTVQGPLPHEELLALSLGYRELWQYWNRARESGDE